MMISVIGFHHAQFDAEHWIDHVHTYLACSGIHIFMNAMHAVQELDICGNEMLQCFYCHDILSIYHFWLNTMGTNHPIWGNM
jgi:hypothetical protein